MNDSAKIYLFPVTENTNKLEYLSKFLAEYTAMIKRLFVAHNINVTKRNIKPTGSNKENNNYRQYIKVASPTIPANDVFALVTSEEAIKSFNEEGIYINDIAFIQDIAGVISKKEVIRYLNDNQDYVMEGSNNDGDYVIMDNDKLVRKNCLPSSLIEYNTSSITGSSSRSRVHLIEARLEAIYWIGFPT